MDSIIAVILMANGAHHKITQITADKLYTADKDALVKLDDGAWVRFSAIGEILPIGDYEYQFPQKQSTDYHQPYSFTSDYPLLPPMKSFADAINLTTKTSHIEAMMKGLQQTIDKRKSQGLSTTKAESLLVPMIAKLKIINGKK